MPFFFLLPLFSTQSVGRRDLMPWDDKTVKTEAKAQEVPAFVLRPALTECFSSFAFCSHSEHIDAEPSVKGCSILAFN